MSNRVLELIIMDYLIETLLSVAQSELHFKYELTNTGHTGNHEKRTIQLQFHCANFSRIDLLFASDRKIQQIQRVDCNDMKHEENMLL